MGTRARIGRQNADGTVTSIYTHWDGYPSHHGPILLDHYTDPAKVDALIALGDCSSLRPEVAPPEGVAHSYDKALPDVTIAYGRDRGEDGTKARTHPAGAWPEYEAYRYLYRDGVWFYAARREELKPLATWQADEES